MEKRVGCLVLLSIGAGYDGGVDLWKRQEEDHRAGHDVAKDSQHAPQLKPSWHSMGVQCRPLCVQYPAM
jgi:hypothetical protein